MMKLIVRVSVIGLVLAGAAASTLTPKTVTANAAVVASHSLVVSSAIPVPSCSPNDGCI